MNGTKLIDKINSRIESSDKFFSLEFFPPRTASGAFNLYEKCSRMSQGQPLFCDVSCSKKNRQFEVASAAQDITKCDTMVQLNSAELMEDSALYQLRQAEMLGLTTIMIVSESTQNEIGDFDSTASLIDFIRAHFKDLFTLCVIGCTTSINDYICFSKLKTDIAAGADFIITNIVFDANQFLSFVQKCRSEGIKIPIIPGILPIQGYNCIKQLSKSCSVQVPNKIMNILKPIQHNDEAVVKYGIYLTVELCKILLESILCCGLHLFTLNREYATTQVLKQLGLWQEIQRTLPWQLSADVELRQGEEVRPIFWACRPASYQHRTSQWDDFPNGRWGDSSVASFGNFHDYRLLYAKDTALKPELRKIWGEELTAMQDVHDIFVAYLSQGVNKNGHKVSCFPWAEEEVAPETDLILNDLLRINMRGILTTNSQPHVNAMPSTHRVFGWGNPGGYVFQKAYLEFFCCKRDAMNLIKVLKNYPLVNYHMVNQRGTSNFTNTDAKSSNAVTWGVFTGRPVIQPTIVDPVAFQYWKDEAFDIWIQQWGALYEEGSKSRRIIENFHSCFYLVNLVDNDYVRGNVLFEIADRVIDMRSDKCDRCKEFS